MKVFFMSLGCDKNLVDSEKMLGLIKDSGHEITDDENEAQVCIINTCCFIHDAKMESIESILSVSGLKETASLKYLIVCGCLAQRYGEDILNEIPEVDAVIGTNACGSIARVIDLLEAGRLKNRVITEAENDDYFAGKRLKSSINHYSYLKIAEGCDKRCTYCIIPSLRGNYRSYPMEKLVEEAKQLALDGVNELILVAQETTLYGIDLYGKKTLPELIRELCRIEGIEWIRLMYCYPEEIDDELIEVFKDEPKLCKYIDMPIQHISDEILKRMGRRTDKKHILGIIKRLKKDIPGMVIRTSLITGFPGETEEEHSELLEFIKSGSLDRAGVFTYSKEDGTPAAKMKGQITKKIKLKRQKELMLTQQSVVFKKNKALVGKKMRVIIDGKLNEDDVYVGRAYSDAPDIDGCIFVNSERDIISGTIIDVKIDSFHDYDLAGHEI